MGDLYFEDRFGKCTLIKSGIAPEKVYQVMQQTMKNVNPTFAIHYIRCWASPQDENTIVYDFGSHSEFFIYKQVGE